MKNKLNWKLTIQAKCLMNLSLMDAIKKTVELGVNCYEPVRTWQKIENQDLESNLNHSLSDTEILSVKKNIDALNAQLTSYCPWESITDKPVQRIFEFAELLGMKHLIMEPSGENFTEKYFDEVERCCEKFDISVILHNHPKPSKYWHPDIILDVCKGRSKKIGAAIDPAAWFSSGLDPLECVDKLKNHILAVHTDDIIVQSDGTKKSVPWGDGDAQLKDVIEKIKTFELDNLLFTIKCGSFATEKTMKHLKKSVEFFNLLA